MTSAVARVIPPNSVKGGSGRPGGDYQIEVSLAGTRLMLSLNAARSFRDSLSEAIYLAEESDKPSRLPASVPPAMALSGKLDKTRVEALTSVILGRGLAFVLAELPGVKIAEIQCCLDGVAIETGTLRSIAKWIDERLRA